jgi:hypothetical protein
MAERKYITYEPLDAGRVGIPDWKAASPIVPALKDKVRATL